MKPNYTLPSSIAFVIAAHASILAAIIYAPKQLDPIVIEPPTIQGIIVSSEPPQPTPPPPQEQKPLPTPETPKIPLPKAPASKRAPQVEQQNPPQEKPVEPTTKPAEPSTAPVVPPQADASQFNNPAPVYPTQSRRLRETGVVVLEVLVKADGSLGDMRLKTSSGYTRLDEAAQKAVKGWRFVPAKRGNEAIDFWYELPVEFSLNR
jgi:protein TonB